MKQSRYTMLFEGGVEVLSRGLDRFEITLRPSAGPRLIASLQELIREVRKDAPPAVRPPLAAAGTLCAECKQPQEYHVTLGSRLLECPNRCPSCGDQAVFYGSDEDGVSGWVMKFADEKTPVDVCVDYCPFCGFDLSGDWSHG